MAGPANSALIASLQLAQAFPHPVDHIKLIETHISWVLLAGEFAYKIKKALTLPFLDYGTLAQRHACCLDELRLNRRFAPDIYLDVVPIGGAIDAPRISLGPPIEWALRMRRFDDGQQLDRLCRRNALAPRQMRQLGQTLGKFHRPTPASGADGEWGRPERVLADARENFVELRRLLPAQKQASMEALAAWTEHEFARRRPAFEARKQNGFIHEGHGDLHLGNLVLIADRIVPFDCIEFNLGLRWIDVASDIAFLWMDLLDHARPDLAGILLNAWLEETGDFAALAVLRFYAVYRALVRAKVAAIRADQSTPGAKREVDDYLALAQVIAGLDRTTDCGQTQARLVITCGFSGSGKTSASQDWLAAHPHACCIRVRSDVERKRLFGLSPLAASTDALAGELYTPEVNRRTYERLLELSAQLIASDYSVVVDAAFLLRAERTAFRQWADAHNTGLRILYCTAPRDELVRRINARHGDASQTTVAVLEKQLAGFEPLNDDEQALCLPEAKSRAPG